MILLDGKATAQKKQIELKKTVDQLFLKTGIRPKLAVVLCGDYPPSQIYVRNKIKACQEVGIISDFIKLPGDITQSNLILEIEKLNQDPLIHGILVQMPLPKGLDSNLAIEAISEYKDVDGFSYSSLGRLMAKNSIVKSCTPLGIMRLLEEYKINVSGLNAAVVGRSTIVGLPMQMMLTHADATVTLCHSKTKNLSVILQQSDLVVVAMHQCRFLGQQDFKKGAIVIDVGIHPPGPQNAKISGDVRYEELENWAYAATPVPGGVGPMTIYALLENTVTLFKYQNKIDELV